MPHCESLSEQYQTQKRIEMESEMIVLETDFKVFKSIQSHLNALYKYET